MAWADLWSWDLAVTYGACAAMFALGVTLWVLGRGVAPRAFGSYLMLWAAGISFNAASRYTLLADADAGRDLLELSFAYIGASLGALVVLIGTYPRPRGPFRSRAFLVTIVAASAVVGVLMLARPHWFEGGTVQDGAWVSTGARPLGLLVYAALVLPGVFAWSLARRLEQEPDPDARRSAFLLALACIPYPIYRAFAFGVGALLAPDQVRAEVAGYDTLGLWVFVPQQVILLVGGAFAVVAGALLVRHVRRTTGKLSMPLVAVLLGGALAQLVRQAVPVPAFQAVVFGVVQLFLPCIAAYALLRSNLLGLDLKVRWGLSKSTVAAVFVAVFFVASEGAQLVFGGENPYVGLVAAGALVFAIAPLQRAADRIAERAVPVDAGTPAPRPDAVPSRREEAYRDALRIALQDRRLTRDEEVRLHRLADELGIAPSRAHQILVEVEREQGAAQA